MTLNLTVPGQEDLKPRITVFGVGGAGGNAVNNMIEKELDGVDFVVANTDAQALQQSMSQSRVQLGVKVTEGLGAGARATVGAGHQLFGTCTVGARSQQGVVTLTTRCKDEVQVNLGQVRMSSRSTWGR